MPKAKKMWVCTECGQESGQWLGKCPNCSTWNSFKEIKVKDDKTNSLQKHSINQTRELSIKPSTISNVLEELKTNPEKRLYPFNAGPLNDFFGGGLTAGSLTLLAGEPGLGKSTLSLQLLRALFSKDKTLSLLYITAEESVHELARRSVRLGIPQELYLAQANNFEQIEQTILENKPNLVIIDSIQTIFSPDIDSAPGSVSQVSTLASRFLAISKAHNLSIIIVGHVTKDGQIAGPKTLEHLVDSVLLLESGENPQYRTLSFSKHRFGSTNGLLLLKMEENGLQIVTDPSLALLENIESGVGVVYGIGMNKDLATVVEIQALAANNNSEFKKGFGQRQAIGITQTKLNTIIAIIEKYLNINLTSTDIFIQISGFSKNLTDSSVDLPVMLAILSSAFNMPVEEILGSSSLDADGGVDWNRLKRENEREEAGDLQIRNGKNKGKTLSKNIKNGSDAIKTSGKNSQKNQQKIAPKNCYAGRLTLSGTIREPTQKIVREDIAKKLGFNFNNGVEFGKIKNSIKVVG